MNCGLFSKYPFATGAEQAGEESVNNGKKYSSQKWTCPG